MIIKSHIRGGYRAAATYLKAIGHNEQIRLVQISDADARDLDQAFQNMWMVASTSRCRKPLHHISINPSKDERLTDEQMLRIVARAEQKYGYRKTEHQRVIVEHMLDGRQHFHVMWCRVSLATGKAVWPGHHWKKSKQICREMEKELGLKRPMPRKLTKGLKIKTQNNLTNSPAPVHPRRYATLSPVPVIRSEVQNRPVPMPAAAVSSSLSGMSEAQRVDFIAACDGKITWKEYFQKWGRAGTSVPQKII